MKTRTLVLLLAFSAGCASASDAQFQKREIKTYPFVASAERAAAIRQGRTQVVVGMSPDQVTAILGQPDEIRELFEPRIKKAKVVGHTYWFVVRRLTPNGNVNERQESLVRVSFDLSDHVSRVDAWGL